MNNLQADGWDLRDIKYAELNNEEIKRWRLERGDIVFNRTNSKALVGKCEVFDQDGTWVFASYLMRLRVASEKARSDFVSAFLNTNAGRIQIDRESREIIGMSNINAEEIRTLRVPLPAPLKQQELVEELDDARSERRAKLAQADKLLVGIDENLAKALGLTLPPPDNKSQSWGVRLGEAIRERRLDPHRFAPRTRKLRLMLAEGAFETRPLSQLIGRPVSGDWGVAENERLADTSYVECLVIRATELDDRETSHPGR